ncbi:hypothetical protein FHS04_001849 [Mesoflavibacter sabulilitoris]|uniref:Uncharacterized protein n=1 Tax=Mesoflavibacter zeaxanthinifaciens subsp. sabulilitoris TaxID=1520893 RepID=A0A2T1NI29_9FLAO|nr:hypothetical protein [Mesoflavibacter zeaxanthinifaciens]MBB3124331.1 hypothetical protein [Mesoflavibacter zeaxanthinifaciens subsp. sabulilitoris]MCP4053382.1 hypothetical protein [Mesoflavibacter sp.]PSG92569.1 hypothetical protein C7H61_03755 [Mesoflavibacter zeaxanthinifaciens subsp. sabulilitoris]
MTTFDQFFFAIFSAFKPKFKQKANSIALFYISILQIALLFVIGAFLVTFLSKMHVKTMSTSSMWTLFIIFSIIIHLKNWMKYNGKSRKVLNAKFNKSKNSYNTSILLLLPIGCIILGLILLKSI